MLHSQSGTLLSRFLLVAVFAGEAVAEEHAPVCPLPAPGIGLLVKAEEMAGVREKVKVAAWAEIYARIQRAAGVAVEQWPKQCETIAPHLHKLWDLSVKNSPTWPADPEVRKAGLALQGFAMSNMCPAAFVYLISGERRYAEAAWGIFQQMGEVNRWGWYPWDGTNMPHIDAGMYARDAAFTLDFLWDYLTPAQRQRARDILAEKCVEPYFRLVLHSPAMGLDHLRSKNQGSNVLAGALIACLALGEEYPHADRWLRSYLQTFHWIVTHDIGWAGQHLESGMPGYWSISMQNLYTGATCLANVTGIDLRGHPAFMEATYYPLFHESSVPPVGLFLAPIDRSYRGPTGVIAGKPIELPHEASCGPWWYDYARRFPQSPALYFINKTMVRKKAEGDVRFRSNDCHQHGHADIIQLLWTTPELYQPNPPQPTELFKTTDRMTMIRSGYGLGETYLYFNGDVFLSARHEVLCTTSALSWHHRWHGWQKAEAGMETEGEPLAPSMVVKESAHDAGFSYLRADPGPSNVTYCRPPGQNSCCQHYTQRQREILYVRGEPGRDYFIFVDRVGQKEPRWHGLLWQTWNAVYENNQANYGRYKIETPQRVRLERPNADLALEFVLPKKAAFEVEAAPGQPVVNYMYDHNVSTLRVLSGGYGAVEGETVTIGPDAWTGAGRVVAGAELGEGAPPAAYRLVGKDDMVGPGNEARNHFEAAAALPPGQRYRMAIRYRKQDCKVYENLCWEIDLELLDDAGKADAFDRDLGDAAKMRPYNLPGEFRLQDARSMTKTTPWIASDWVYFDVPPQRRVSKIRGTLRAALYSHPPHGIHNRSVLELGPVTIEPLGSVERRKEDTFVTVAFPLEKQASSPAITSEVDHGTACAKICVDADVTDYLIVGRRKPLVFDGGRVAAQLALLRCRDGKVRQVFARDARSISLKENELLHSDAPVDLSARLDQAGRIAEIHISTEQPANVTLQGQRVHLPAAAFVAGPHLHFRLDPARTALEANSPESRALLQRGLAPLIEKIRAERDQPAAKGMKNLALGATVTASAVRDPRFPPQLVADNKTWEYPADGLLDYTQGELLTTPAGGYNQDEAVPLAGGPETPMTSWPFYVRPTYWLLPYQTTGWIQLELPRPSPVRLVRLLNTSNAGANDYATMKYHVELLNARGHVVGRGQGEFGRAFDRPFQAAFMIPAAFSHYGPTFCGMLEPGVKVPFGDGWQSIRFDAAPLAKFVKVYIDSYWALGGGLNEIQVY